MLSPYSALSSPSCSLPPASVREVFSLEPYPFGQVSLQAHLLPDVSPPANSGAHVKSQREVVGGDEEEKGGMASVVVLQTHFGSM